MNQPDLKPQQRVRIEQSIHTRQGDWKTRTEGEVVAVERKPTGSWYAHGRFDKLWLKRIRLRRDDGELIELVLDRDTQVVVLNEKETDG